MKNVYPQRFVFSKTMRNKTKRLFSKTLFAGMAIAACFGFATNSHAQCTTGNTSTPASISVLPTKVIGQSVTTTCSGNIREASFHLPLAAVGSSQQIFLKVYIGNGLAVAVNSNPIPVTAVVNANHDAVIDFSTFPVAVSVLANSQYTFTAFQTAAWVVGSNAANPYSGGNAYLDPGTGVTALPTTDVGFTLKICDPTSSTTNTTACDSLVWNGTTYKTSGNYSKTFPSGNSGGCDSTAYLNLTVNNSKASDTTASACNSFTWHGVTYYRTGDKFDTLQTTTGCDSIVTLHLTILSVNNTFTKTDAGCFGSATGSITITPTSGTGPYKYRLGTVGPIAATSGTFNNVKAGSYRVYVQDNTGCIGVAAPVVIGQSAKVDATVTGTNLSCSGSGNGSITISNPVGVGPFQYKIGNTGSVYTAFTAPVTVPNLKAGRYAVYIKDQSSCQGPANVVTITQPGKISATFSKMDETCPSAKDGSIAAQGTGGLSPYEYRLNTTGTYGQSNTFPGLAAGTYKVYAKDSRGCQGVSPVVTIIDVTDPCPPPPPFARTAPKTNIDKALKLSLMPNPSASQFRLVAHSGSAESVSVRVIDANGRNVYEIKGQSEQSFMFGDKLSNGLYMIEVRQGNEVKTIKAMKQR